MKTLIGEQFKAAMEEQEACNGLGSELEKLVASLPPYVPTDEQEARIIAVVMVRARRGLVQRLRGWMR